MLSTLIVAVGPAVGALNDQNCFADCSVESQCGPSPVGLSGPSPGPEPARRLEDEFRVTVAGRTDTYYERRLAETLARENAVNAAHDACRREDGELRGERPLHHEEYCKPHAATQTFMCFFERATFVCERSRENPAHAVWRERVRERDEALRAHQASLQPWQKCVAAARGREPRCRADCSAAARGPTTTRPRAGGTRGGGTTTTPGRPTTGSSSASGSSSTRSRAGTFTARPAPRVPTGSGSVAGSVGGLIGTAAGLVAVMVAGGSSPAGQDEEVDWKMELENAAAATRRGGNHWVGPLVSGGLLVSSLSLMGGLSALNGTLRRDADDLVRPADRHGAAAVLLGPLGAGTWWAPFEVRITNGYTRFGYDGFYLHGRGESALPRPRDRGLPIAQTVGGFSSGIALRKGLFRASLHYLGASSALLEGSEAELAARMNYETRGTQKPRVGFTEDFSMQGYQASAGLQLFGGLFSPYVEYQRTSLALLHRAGHYASWYNPRGRDAYSPVTAGHVYLAPSGALVLGNTFSFMGAAPTEGPLRRAILIDFQYRIGLHGPLTGGWQLSFGYGITSF